VNFNEYQDKVNDLAMYPGQGTLIGVFYAALGCAGEAGEVAEQVKKTWRDDGASYATSILSKNVVGEERRDRIMKEIGDNLWYISQLATELDINLEDVAIANIDKLHSRKRRNMISGEGSDR
jgi:NTP pyrophosphatase (non-canonical NTP hydrolase)